jgi:ribose transport system substrate-binding protein
MFLVVVGVLVSACGSSSSSSSSSTGSETTGSETKGGEATTADSGGESFSIAYFSPIQANNYISAMSKAIEKTAKENGADVTIVDAGGNSNKQIADIETATAAKKYDGYIVTPLSSPSVIGALTKAIQEGVKVACLEGTCGPNPVSEEAELDGITVQEGISFQEEGELQAEAVNEACKGINPCTVLVTTGIADSSLEVARKKYFYEKMESYPDIKIVKSETETGENAGKAQPIVASALEANPDVNVIAANGDESAHGAQLALEKSGQLDEIKIVSEIAEKYAVEQVANGNWFAEAAPEYPGKYAQKTTEYLIEALEGKKVPQYFDGNEGIEEPRILYQKDAKGFEAEW